MKSIAASVLFALLVSTNLQADWDPELEKQEAAERAANQKAQAKQEAEVEALRTAAMRQALGEEASGMSDDQVRQRYRERFDANAVKSDANSARPQANQDIQRAIAPNKAQIDAASKAMTGKTVEEMQNMSEAELEAMARELEKKYGQ